jgi:hypothetical protein
LELLYKLNEYSYSSEESPDSLDQESEFLTSTKNLTLITKKSFNLPERRFFVHQAFNMNPMNFVDPWGEGIFKDLWNADWGWAAKQTGKDLARHTWGTVRQMGNTAGFAVESAVKTVGFVEDKTWDIADFFGSKLGLFERGDLYEDKQLRSFITAVIMMYGVEIINDAKIAIQEVPGMVKRGVSFLNLSKVKMDTAISGRIDEFDEGITARQTSRQLTELAEDAVNESRRLSLKATEKYMNSKVSSDVGLARLFDVYLPKKLSQGKSIKIARGIRNFFEGIDKQYIPLDSPLKLNNIPEVIGAFVKEVIVLISNL